MSEWFNEPRQVGLSSKYFWNESRIEKVPGVDEGNRWDW